MNELDRIGRAAAQLLGALALVVAPAAAQGGSSSGAGDGESGGGGGGGLQLASEAIGTLPTWWVDDALPLVTMPEVEETQFQLDTHLETYVPAELLDDFVAEAAGTGYVFLSLPDFQDGFVRVRFFGDVQVALDRTVVQSAGLSLALQVGAGNAGGLGLLAVDGDLSPPFSLDLPGGAIDVPLGTSPAFDVLFEATPISLYTIAATGEPAGSGWDVGRIDVAVDATRYRFDLSVEASLLP